MTEAPRSGTGRLAIILVNYRGTADTIACVRSLRTSAYRDFTLFIVENGSGGDVAAVLRRECPEAELIVNATNLGFAGGNNVAVRAALGRGCELVLLLNNDTIVREDAVGAIVDAMAARPEAGVVGGKIMYDEPRTRIWFGGGIIDPDSGFGVHEGLNEDDHGQCDTAHECGFISGCFLLTRRPVLERIGLLDESYFAYFEDSDYCLRARRAGYTVWYEPRAVIYHKAHRTTEWDSPFYVYFNLRNKILFIRKNGAGKRWLLHLPRLTYFYLRQFIRLAVKWRKFPSARAAWMGLVDGLRNYTGSGGRGRLDRL